MPEMIEKLVRAIWRIAATVTTSADWGHRLAAACLYASGAKVSHDTHEVLGLLAVISCGQFILHLAKRKRDASDALDSKKTDGPQGDTTENGSALQGEDDNSPHG